MELPCVCVPALSTFGGCSFFLFIYFAQQTNIPQLTNRVKGRRRRRVGAKNRKPFKPATLFIPLSPESLPVGPATTTSSKNMERVPVQQLDARRGGGGGCWTWKGRHRRACTATLFPHSIVSGVAPHYHSRWDGAWKSQGVDSNGGGCGGSGWTIESNGIHRSITFSSGCREVTVRASSSTSRRGNWRKAIAPQQQKYINARGFHHVLSIDISSIYAGASLSCLTRTNPFSSTRERRKWLNLVSLSRNSLLRTSYWE